MRRATTTLLIATLSMAAAPPADAQQGAAEIRGRVVDPHGGVLPGTTVVLRHQATGMFRQVVSSAEGVYFLSGVTPGVYETACSTPRTYFFGHSQHPGMVGSGNAPAGHPAFPRGFALLNFRRLGHKDRPHAPDRAGKKGARIRAQGPGR